MSTKASATRKVAGRSDPIDLLRSNAGNVYTHAHPFLVLGVFAASFRSTVADPVSSIARLTIPLALLQCVYAVICIPTLSPAAQSQLAGSGKASSDAASSISSLRGIPGFRRKAGAGGKIQTSLGSKVIVSGHREIKSSICVTNFLANKAQSQTAVLSTILSLVLATPLLTVLIILHGAPATTHHAHTLLLAAHSALLSTIPLFYAHGISGAKWRELLSLSSPIDELTGGAMGVLVGAWVGAVPIPLDWDRDWQKWPVTVLSGAYIGWAAGKTLGGTIGKGRKIHWGL